MAKFLVKVTCPHIAVSGEYVEADYHRIEYGALIFRNQKLSDGYPTFVKAYSAGGWVSVEKVNE